MHICMNTCTHTYTYMYTYIHTCTFIYKNVSGLTPWWRAMSLVDIIDYQIKSQVPGISYRFLSYCLIESHR